MVCVCVCVCIYMCAHAHMCLYSALCVCVCALAHACIQCSLCVWDGTQWYDLPPPHWWWHIRWVLCIQILGKWILFVAFTPIQYETTIWNIFFIMKTGGMFNRTCCLSMCTDTFYHKQDVCMYVNMCVNEWINEFDILVRYSVCKKKNSLIVCVFGFLISFVMLDGCRARTRWVEM